MPTRISTKHCALIFALSMLVRLAFIFGAHLYQTPFRVEVDRVATSISRGEGFANPFRCTTGPTAIYPPVYPSILAANYRLFGTGRSGELSKDILNSAMVSLAFALLPFVAVRLGFKPVAGLLAAAFGALVPVYIYSEIRGGDASLIAIAVELAVILTFRRAASQDWRTRSGLLDGLFWGAGLMVASSLASILAACCLFSLYRGGRRAARYLAWMAPGIFILVLPWTLRNEIAVHGLLPLRSNLWLELQISNNEPAGLIATKNQESGVYARYHPFSNPAECAEMARMGELNYMATKKTLVLDYVRSHPGRFVGMTIQRAVAFWFPPPIRWGQAGLAWIISLLALLGLWKTFRDNPAAAQLIGLVWLCFPLLYYLIAIDNRYRYPIYWSFLLLAVVGIDAAWARISHRNAAVHAALNPQELTGVRAARFQELRAVYSDRAPCACWNRASEMTARNFPDAVRSIWSTLRISTRMPGNRSPEMRRRITAASRSSKSAVGTTFTQIKSRCCWTIWPSTT